MLHRALAWSDRLRCERAALGHLPKVRRQCGSRRQHRRCGLPLRGRANRWGRFRSIQFHWPAASANALVRDLCPNEASGAFPQVSAYWRSLLDELREAVTDEKHKANITASAGFELWEAAANRVDDALLACINAGASKDELADVSGRPIERVRVLSRLAKAWKLAHQVVGVHARDGITIRGRANR